MVTLWLALGLWGAAPVQAPSVAVLHVTGKGSASSQQLDLLTDALTASVSSSKRFRQVTSARQLEQALSLERQRQLLDCSSDSCMAEIAGALGVDFILSCSLGRLGELWLVNLALVQANTGTVVAAVANKLDGDELDVVVRALDVMVDELLDDAAIPRPEGARVMRKKTGARRDLSDPPRRQTRMRQPRGEGVMGRVWKLTGLTAAACSGGTLACGGLTFVTLGAWLLGFPAQPLIFRQVAGGQPLHPANQAINLWNLCGGPIALCLCALPVPFLCVGSGIGWLVTATAWVMSGSAGGDDLEGEEDSEEAD
jgi:hypothetical protein